MAQAQKPKTPKKLVGTAKPKGKAPAEVARSAPATVPNKVGRPSEFTQATADEICEHLAIGESIRTVCAPDHMPSIATFFKWLRTYPEFLKQYTHAKEEAADAMAEDILDISDDGTNDWMERNYGDNEVWVTNGEALQRSRLRVETRKWLMAKMKPRRYGEKIDHTSDGKALPQPILAVLAAGVAPNPDVTDEIEKPYIDGEVSEKPAQTQVGNIMDEING